MSVKKRKNKGFVKKVVFLLLVVFLPINFLIGLEVFGEPGYLGMRYTENNQFWNGWRPFSDNSPWNIPIPANAPLHSKSTYIIDNLMGTQTTYASVRLGKAWNPTLHFVDSNLWQSPKYYFRSLNEIYHSEIYHHSHEDELHTFDPDVNSDYITDVPYCYHPDLTFPENTADGHMIIVDIKNPNRPTAVEVTKGTTTVTNNITTCTTFNYWDLTGTGTVHLIDPVATPDNWYFAGGRGAGVPIIGGLIRPQEIIEAMLQSDQAQRYIHHALAFACTKNRHYYPLYPFAYRNDGALEPPSFPNRYPVEGMQIQLNPALTEADLNSFGLNEYQKIIARTLQKYGAIDVENGGNDNEIVLAIQNLSRSGISNCATESNCAIWNELFYGIYNTISTIPRQHFRVIDTQTTLNAMYLTNHYE